MTRSKYVNARKATSIAPWLLAMLTLSTACSLIISAGCKTRIIAIPSDKVVLRLRANEPFTPTNGPGYFVPDARMQEILSELEQK